MPNTSPSYFSFSYLLAESVSLEKRQTNLLSLPQGVGVGLVHALSLVALKEGRPPLAFKSHFV